MVDRVRFGALFVCLVVVLLTIAAGPARADDRLMGAGATFPAPLYKRWVVDYEKSNPGVSLDYNSIGSGGGIKAVTEKTVAFGATDAPLTKRELEALGGADKVIIIPTCAGAVVPAYNLPGIDKPVNFSGPVLAEIFAGVISKWNDPKLAELNPGVKLPDLAITPVWRTDGSGTTFVWSSYLASQSETFKSSVGMGKQVRFPVGQGGKGNEGVAAAVQQSAGALGYIELNYATANKIAFGAVKNAAGKLVKASTDSVATAGVSAAEKLSGSVLTADLWNQPGDASYPVSAFTYIIVYKDLSTNVPSEAKAKALAGFLTWATTTGQEQAKSMDYAPLAPAVQAKVAQALSQLTYKGAPIAAAKPR